MNCKHKTYQGKRAPSVDCKDCWMKYFETDTDKKKKKYPDEYDKYINVTKTAITAKPKKETAKPKTSSVRETTTPFRADKDGNKIADVPIRMNQYFWSQEIKATMKLVNISNGILAFIVDAKIIIPITEVEKYKLIPFSGEYFSYSTKRIPKQAEGKTMAVFPAEENQNLVATDILPAPTWPTDDIFWQTGNKMTIEGAPQPIDPDKPVKKPKKKVKK